MKRRTNRTGTDTGCFLLFVAGAAEHALLRRAGGEVAGSVLDKIVAGTAIVALAAAEPTSGDDWQDVSTTAQRDGDDWVLHGSKIVVMSAPLATHLLITARTSGTDGISLFLADFDPGAPGMASRSMPIGPLTTAAPPTSSSMVCDSPPRR